LLPARFVPEALLQAPDDTSLDAQTFGVLPELHKYQLGQLFSDLRKDAETIRTPGLAGQGG
jgi:hypothetical protein